MDNEKALQLPYPTPPPSKRRRISGKKQHFQVLSNYLDYFSLETAYLFAVYPMLDTPVRPVGPATFCKKRTATSVRGVVVSYQGNDYDSIAAGLWPTLTNVRSRQTWKHYLYCCPIPHFYSGLAHSFHQMEGWFAELQPTLQAVSRLCPSGTMVSFLTLHFHYNRLTDNTRLQQDAGAMWVLRQAFLLQQKRLEQCRQMREVVAKVSAGRETRARMSIGFITE